MQAFGLFRGEMSSWCSFRCPCLDELGSKSDVNILYLFCCKMCVFHVLQTVRLVDDCFWSGGFFGVVFGPWVQHLHLLNFSEGSWCTCMVLTHDVQKLSLDSMLLISGLAGFNQFFPNAGFWPLPGQNVFLVFIQVSVPR